MSTRRSNPLGFLRDVNLAIKIPQWLLTAWILFLFLSPLIYGFSISLRPQTELFGDFHLVPYEPTLDAWAQFMADAGADLINSVFVATGTTILVLLISVPAAYAFSRTEFPGRKTLFYVIIFIMLVPIVMLVVPLAQIWRDAGLFNTLTGLWLALIIGAIPVGIWILRDNFQKLPQNAEEAAQVYGCTQFQAFVNVILPLAAPAIIAVGFLTFLGAWNAFLFPNILVTGEGPQPAIVTLFHLLSEDKTNPWTYVMAGAYMVAIPPATFYILARRYLARALAF